MLDPQVILADARRGSIEGAVGDAPDRPGLLVGEPVSNDVRTTVPAGSPLAVAINGSGLFVVLRNGVKRYARRGDFQIDAKGHLTDRSGSLALGFRVNDAGAPTSGLVVCQVPAVDMAAQRYSSYRIDERGILFGEAERVDGTTGRRQTRSNPIARLALAIFPAPERLARDGDVLLAATSAAGDPVIVSPGEPGVSRLRVRMLEAGTVDVEGDLARLWAARRQLDAQVAIASATDRDARTALGLVK
ncbi:MAG TPA: flagellar basal body rod C-terminal domain-containing protein [Candidatus Eremiobacteraceae bacterium]|nr:flagellar basal body rod C-terminal domain-containing protein [Candidatus Eremiobacteraceae bacterium]